MDADGDNLPHLGKVHCHQQHLMQKVEGPAEMLHSHHLYGLGHQHRSWTPHDVLLVVLLH